MRQRLRSPTPDVEDTDEGQSKTQIKDEMHALKDLGAALLELPDARLDELEMSEQLRDALRDYRRIPTMNAQARQLGFIGKLMRSVEPEPLQRAVDEHRHAHLREAQSLRELEAWRDRLLADDAAMTAWCAKYPGGDTRALRALIAKARREMREAEAAAKPGAAPRKGRYYRELFQQLTAAVKASLAPS